MKQTPMRLARAVGDRKLIFAMIQRHNLSNAVAAAHLKQIGNANPSTIVNERSQSSPDKPQRKAA